MFPLFAETGEVKPEHLGSKTRFQKLQLHKHHFPLHFLDIKGKPNETPDKPQKENPQYATIV